MPNHDDYDLIETEETDSQPKRGTSPLIWLVIVLVLVLFGFTVGLAAVRILSRLTAEPTPLAIEETATPAATAAAVVALPTKATPTPDGSEEATIAATEAASPSGPTATPSPVPATATPASAACQFPVDPSFPNPDELGGLGCAISPPSTVVWAAWEPFERGSMLWRSDTDRAYIFAGDGRWFPVTARWNGEPLSPRGAPPPGRYEPQRGFGYVWGADDAIYDTLGWAMDEEKGFCARVQDFENGFVIQSNDAPSCTAEGLYNQATSADWRPLTLVADETLRVGAASPVDAPAPEASTGDINARPARNGVLFAPSAGSLPRFDGNFSEWPNAWQPLDAVVYGAGDYDGPADLRGVYQAAWADDGLILAVRVNDDVYRPGPPGSDMWQGDGLEIHFDRLLADDFTDWDANEDDYQIGVSFGPDFAEVDAYRWLPYTEETTLNLPGVVRPLGEGSAYRGYNVEMLIPWTIFGLNGQNLNAGDRYGFNLSMNDNDGETPAQQVTISLSPAAHDA